MEKENSIMPLFYKITLFFLTLSGFGQMPIFKRYYIADIPGLGWLANFHITHLMHYIFAGIFISLVVYSSLDFIIFRIDSARITKIIIIKIIIYLGLIITGILMIIKNFSGTPFSPNFIILLALSHFLFCILLLFFLGYHLTKKFKT
ncbi:MAG: hypothetical protein B6I26_03565 [Desulfobacteraceae bacterium 4572_130]|nr:MAG: hypothetical protein B6I26_03565 [Desulfobacteraceae bacterium 4572_130]